MEQDQEKGKVLNETVVESTQPQLIFKQCVPALKHTLDYFLGQPGAAEKLYNVRGNAWDLANSAFGQTIEYTPGMDLQQGDIVVMSRRSFESDQKNGIPDHDQHVGMVSYVSGVPKVVHYVPKVTTDQNGKKTYEPQPYLLQDIDRLSAPGLANYTPSKIIRLNVNSDNFSSDPNYSNKFKAGNKNQIGYTEDYGVNTIAAIEALNRMQDYKKYGLTPNEDMELKLLTLSLMNTESDFGGSKRGFIRQLAPEYTNIVKEIQRGKWTEPAYGYGSMRHSLWQTPNYTDLQEQLKNGSTSRKEYYKLVQDRYNKERALNSLNQMGIIPDTGYMVFDYSTHKPQYGNLYDQSYNLNVASLMGINAQGMGKSVEDDTGLLYSILVGMHKKYPNLSINELAKLYRGSDLPKAVEEKLNNTYEQFRTGTFKPTLIQRAGQRVTRTVDQAKEAITEAKQYIADRLPLGANWKGAATIMGGANYVTNPQLKGIQNDAFSNFSDEEKAALLKAIKHAEEEGRNYVTYSDMANDDGTVGGKGNIFKSLYKNIFDPTTTSQNYIGQFSFRKQNGKYIIDDSYDFNNAYTLMNPLQKLTPNPYSYIRNNGTIYGAPDGAGRKIHIELEDAPKIDKHREGGKIKYFK